MKKIGLIAAILWLAVVAGGLYVAGSLVVSGVKAATSNCSKHFVAEKFVSGDWFCPTPDGK